MNDNHPPNVPHRTSADRGRRRRRAAVLPGAAGVVRAWPTAAGHGGRCASSSRTAARRSADAVGPPLTEFELTERSGKPFRSADMKGKVWVATYFFTTCPGNCIRLNQNIQLMHNLPELKDVTWVSITCDPDNDTLEALSKYADSLQADPERWLFCRGPISITRSASPRA